MRNKEDENGMRRKITASFKPILVNIKLFPRLDLFFNLCIS
ncbi:MAG: hypothetical protein ACXWFC_03845 [Nitrososphaeraceae archaeon]